MTLGSWIKFTRPWRKDFNFKIQIKTPKEILPLIQN